MSVNYSNRRKAAKAKAKQHTGRRTAFLKSAGKKMKDRKKPGPGRDCSSPFQTRCENIG